MYKQSPTKIKVILNTPIAANKNIQNTLKVLLIKNVINNYDLKPNTLAHIKDAENSNRPDPLHTKPTTQPIRLVTSVALKRYFKRLIKSTLLNTVRYGT